MATCPKCHQRYANDVQRCERDGQSLLPDLAFASEDSDFRPGDTLGEYCIEGELGRGGYGTVYKALQPLIEKPVAIKVLNRELCSNPRVVARFVAEARSVNQIRHRNIVDIFGFGVLPDGRYYFVMELLEGMTLRHYLKQRKQLDPEQAIGILRPIAHALDAAHQAGIVHRDLKPDNVFLVFDRNGGVFPKIIDFGIAKLLDATLMGTAALTHSGAPMGTPAYMSPEQCSGHNVDQRSDIYSFGVLTHELLTGQMLFESNNAIGMYFNHTRTEPPAMSDVCGHLPVELDAPVLRMLQKDPAARPRSLGAAVEALAKAAERAGLMLPASQRNAAPSARALKLIPANRTDFYPRVESEDIATHRAVTFSNQKRKSKRKSSAIWISCATSLGVIFSVWFGSREQSTPVAAGAGALAHGAAVVASPPKSTPVASAEAAAPPPPQKPDVELRFQSTPKLVEIYAGSERLGSSQKPLYLPRSDVKVKLTVTAKGYLPSQVEVVPSGDAIVSVKLTRKPRKPRKPRTINPASELENPF